MALLFLGAFFTGSFLFGPIYPQVFPRAPHWPSQAQVASYVLFAPWPLSRLRISGGYPKSPESRPQPAVTDASPIREVYSSSGIFALGQIGKRPGLAAGHAEVPLSGPLHGVGSWCTWDIYPVCPQVLSGLSLWLICHTSHGGS